jgi:hypothetical protein
MTPVVLGSGHPTTALIYRRHRGQDRRDQSRLSTGAKGQRIRESRIHPVPASGQFCPASAVIASLTRARRATSPLLSSTGASDWLSGLCVVAFNVWIFRLPAVPIRSASGRHHLRHAQEQHVVPGRIRADDSEAVAEQPANETAIGRLEPGSRRAPSG